ncbi:MAG: hypothetical protein ACYSU6_04695 [Planctomycetota bacterium]|jgi:hypothetical protein
MNKKQLIVMWVGILFAILAWLNRFDEDTPMMSTSIPIIAVITGGLVISFSDRNYKKMKEIVDKILSLKVLKPVKEFFKDFYESVIKGKEIPKEDKPKDSPKDEQKQ